MEKLIDVASYIYNRYLETKGEAIDEMKLHKMLYFAQRESIIQNNEPLFEESFYGWKFGPVLKEIRAVYKDGAFLTSIDTEVVEHIQDVMDIVFEEYADKKSWSLSRLTHGEYSWQHARVGIDENAHGDQPLLIEDIAQDAQRVCLRRKGLASLGITKGIAPYENHC